ncbi:LLM class F420-dependent oxidoreductase [Mycobacterium sp. TNTM28]|uniref:LLM class F420-dependent oxidoreductase n=1 Tax=[Mycobacterium] fortunisiensis TaxID=2600579 RepID=A0ABS6KLF0_9MYCO|nr:LLM class F420-dependent oxidoreductase [[Mycobacterium] fortunisiensis]MBU9764329.1 LLM class F420-dependent oxidoreductase [[Mycobacterium] fortunisiensis]
MSNSDCRGLKIDRGIPSLLTEVADTARELEAQGYDGCFTGEINHDPFLPLTIAAEHTTRIQLGTSIAVAFARSPMTTAQLGWDLQTFSGGRFILGLGTQIQPHIEKRFSMPWSHPARRMREYIEALHAIWGCWRDGTKLRFEGEFYTHKIMTPMFTPEPSDLPHPKVFLAAVGELMTEVCGEVADGLLAHAFTTRRYLDEVTLAALQRGLDRSGRDRGEVELSCPVFIVTGADEQEMAAASVATRKQLAFYGSTPAYRKVLDLHGWGELHTELHRLSLAGEWDTMGTLIDDEVLAAFAVVAPLAELAGALQRRCAGVIDRVLPGFPAAVSPQTVNAVLRELRESPQLRSNV